MSDANENRKAAERLDVLLVKRGEFPSRSRAKGAIEAGFVRVAGVRVDRPSTLVDADAPIKVDGDVHDYVSRGALKLEAALKAFEFSPRGGICLDLGASTGGFSEVLLRRGASKVYAVDVGGDQLHPKIVRDPRIVNLEKTHSKDLSIALIPERIDFFVVDVSFISLTKALPPALALAAPTARLVALIKPQFELGPEKIGKGGLVKASAEDYRQLTDKIAAWLARAGWRSPGVIESPIAGGDGNREFLLGAIRST